jgi:SAM-dependent methyltransferase
MAEVVVSDMDIRHLAIVRKNVNDTMALAVANHDRPGVRVLEIGPPKTGGAKDHFKHAAVTTLDIKPGEGVDIVADAAERYCVPYDLTWDIVLCFEVLEHADEPLCVAENMYNFLSVGGMAYITTPFNLRIHGPLPDNYRFTEHALRRIFSIFDEVQITAIETPGRDLMPICYQTIVTKK